MKCFLVPRVLIIALALTGVAHAASQFNFELITAPENSEFGTALATDGTYVYYFRMGNGNLWRYDPATSAWTALASAPNNNTGGPASLAFYAGLGAQGSLLAIRNVTGETDPLLHTYDIATDTWTARGQRKFGNTGFVVIGSMLYGNAHASQVNQGGPTTVADLTNPDAQYCKRAAFPQWSASQPNGIKGPDFNWFSRVVQMAAVDGKLYGFKNDWTSPAPNPSGDRLWVADPSTMMLNNFNGPNWDNWDHATSPVTDLGPLPVEPGYGSAMVALPPGWSTDIGTQGGLLIIAGRSPSNNEGWGNPSNKYALYDIATGVFTNKTLPATTGTGTSATILNGKVYIKRGGQPDAPYNADLWILSTSPGNPCDAPQTVNITSTGVANVAIGIEPNDCGGQGNGTTPFTRNVGLNDLITLTAPTFKGYEFLGWSINGAPPVSTEQSVTVQISSATTVAAVYQLRCATPQAFTVSASGVSGSVTIQYSPASCDGQMSGVAPFTASFGNGEQVTLAAPYIPHRRFVQWTVAGGESVLNPTITLTADGTKDLTAMYELEQASYKTGCYEFVSLFSPVAGEAATSLASDGNNLYFLTVSGKLFRSPDGHGWLPLATLPGTGAGYDAGSLAFYGGLGAQGSLLSYRNLGLMVYDIATDTWTAHGNKNFGQTGFTVIGDYLYGNSHAAAVNQGGPTTVADLLNLDAESCQRAAFSGMAGGNPTWFSRVVQMTTIEGLLYGIKNDWTTTPDVGDGDRLWRIDPKDLVLNQKTGPNWDEWTHNNSPVTDLAQLPFEVGYGSAIVALPPKWSCDVGDQGGLLIIAGRSPSNHEGYGDAASDAFTVYDIASGQFHNGSLPLATGSGTSAAIHKNKVYIKHGGEPQGPYDSTIWVMSLPSVRYDLDSDGHVSPVDLSLYLSPCTSGPTVPLATVTIGGQPFDCRVADYDADGDVDHADFGLFQQCMTGPSDPIMPGCE